MFSIILKIQAYLEKFRKNKGLFFTTLTISSIFAIVISIWYISTVSSRSASAVYKVEKSRFLSTVEEKLVSKAEQLLSNGVLISKDNEFIADVYDANSTGLSAYLSSKTREINSFSTSAFAITLFSADRTVLFSSDAKEKVGGVSNRSSLLSTVSTAKPSVGLEFLGGEVWIRAILPILKEGEAASIGALEVRQTIDFILDALHEEKREFMFLLNKDFLDREDFNKLNYAEVNVGYITVDRNFDREFYDFLNRINFKEFMDGGYILDPPYYATYRIVDDVEGNPFGMFVVGENFEKSGSVIDALTVISKKITIAALGLVVALLILMI